MVNVVMEKNLNNYAKLENTRMIFDFMQELDYRCTQVEHYNGIGGLSKRFENIKQLSESVKSLLQESYTEQGELLHQNPLTQYIIFWNEMYTDCKIDLGSNNYYTIVLANMLNYFRQIKELEIVDKSSTYNDNLPYIYEDICLSVCSITEYDMCYIFYREADGNMQTVSRSGYLIEEITHEIFDVKPDDIIRNCKQEWEKIKGVYCFTNENEPEVEYVVITLPEHYYKTKTERNFYIVLQKAKNGVSEAEDVLKRMSRILFLRDRFLNKLKRDFAVLLNFRFDVSYIKSVCKSDDKSLSVLHITDAHINENKKWEFDSATVKAIIKKIKTAMEKNNSIDLIAITGDIVNASNNATDAQQKYIMAGKVIQEIASQLWKYSFEKCGRNISILPSDWKRRIIITTGNHDYAAMNDVIVQTKSRVIRSASPSKNSGGTMSKFTYFIEFLQNFLDAPIDVLIENDLNEIRRYRNLKLEVVVLNTVSLANSLQNNKVGFNTEKVEHLTDMVWRNTQKNKRCIFLAHHSPQYEINYIRDIYAPHKLFSQQHDSEVKKLYQSFENLITKNPNYYNNEEAGNFEKEFCQFSDLISSYQKGVDDSEKLKRLKKIVQEWKKCSESDVDKYINSWITGFYASDLFADMRELYNYISGAKSSTTGVKTEFSLQLLSKLNNMCETNNYDKNLFEKTFHKVINRMLTSRKDSMIGIVLAGHEHKCAINKVKTLNRPLNVYIEDMLEKSLSIITIDDKNLVKRTKCS